uniref:S1-like domain-containing protein n=1 Tax=viral metagenome TaxID=1070528 RepID=A0A6C0B466_9ZZZZ
MVKNRGGKKTKGKSRKTFRMKELGIQDLKKIDNQEYAHVLSVFGDGRYDLICYDKKKRLGILRGRVKRTARINKGDLVLVSIREFQDNKCDILAGYSQTEADKLIKEKEVFYSFVKSGELIQNLKDDFAESVSDDEEEVNNHITGNTVNQTGLNIDDI